MPTGAARAARTDSAKSFLQSESAALDYRLVRALHVVLGQKIDCRLAELGEMLPQGRCLCCGYTSAIDICFCCQGGCWPPYSSFFRCEVQARLAWYALGVVLFTAPGLHPIFVALLGQALVTHPEARA